MKIIKLGTINTLAKKCKRCGCIFQIYEEDINIVQINERDDNGNLKIKTKLEIKCPNCSEIYEVYKKGHPQFL